MQTRYNLLYRYMNENTNTPVTNESEYEKTEEFYTKEHKFNLTDKQLQSDFFKNYALKWEYDAISSGISGTAAMAEAALAYANTMKNNADTEREEMITENMANLEKSNLLYVYNGTKRVFHKVYIPDQLGYKVKDWTRVPADQIPSGPDDFSKHFVMMGGYQLGVDGAYLVCKPEYIKNYMKYKNGSTKCFLCLKTQGDTANTGYKNNAAFNIRHTYLGGEFDLKKIIDEEIFFEWYDITSGVSANFGEVATPKITGTVAVKTSVTSSSSDPGCDIQPTVVRTEPTGGTSGTPHNVNNYYFFWNNSEGKEYLPGMPGVLQSNTIPASTPDMKTYFNKQQYTTGSVSSITKYTGWDAQDLSYNGYTNIATEITVTAENIIREVIPEHYEETGTNPYFIKDTYKKIPFSPWMMHSAHNSLESALAMARKLVSMVGIKNVKLIKYVPIDQHVKVK